VQRKTDESAADRHIRTIGRLGGDRVKLLGDTEGRSILARVEAIGIESEYRSQPVPGVVEVGLLQLPRGVTHGESPDGRHGRSPPPSTSGMSRDYRRMGV